MNILVCVAGLPYGEPTIRFAGTVAGLTESSLTLLHVAPRDCDRANSVQVLDAAVGLLPDLAVETSFRQGNPARMILAEIGDNGYDMVIIGANQTPGLRQRLLGSVARQVTSRSPVSVLVVKSTKSDLSRLLICTGGAKVSELAIETGAMLAKAAGARATLLHVIGSVPSMYTGLEEIEETLSELLQTDTLFARHLRHGAETLSARGVKAELRLRMGGVTGEILREIDDGEYGLLVVGASRWWGRGLPTGWLLGDITREVVDNAPCSVLVVRE
jgi:nucleotide-binding universal stress UspA family protein